ncbi:hypothetical protein NL676_025274 [Syzygium grande]|nr:hypothetical protein NL676_025274 [Syzygium grande]
MPLLHLHALCIIAIAYSLSPNAPSLPCRPNTRRSRQMLRRTLGMEAMLAPCSRVAERDSDAIFASHRNQMRTDTNFSRRLNPSARRIPIEQSTPSLTHLSRNRGGAANRPGRQIVNDGAATGRVTRHRG